MARHWEKKGRSGGLGKLGTWRSGGWAGCAHTGRRRKHSTDCREATYTDRRTLKSSRCCSRGQTPWPPPCTDAESLLSSCSLASPTRLPGRSRHLPLLCPRVRPRTPGCLPLHAAHAPPTRRSPHRALPPPPSLRASALDSVRPPLSAALLGSHLSLCISASRASQERSPSLGLWVLVDPWLCPEYLTQVISPTWALHASSAPSLSGSVSVLLGTCIGGCWGRHLSPISHPRGKGNGGGVFLLFWSFL